jgi:hypothetical protein
MTIIYPNPVGGVIPSARGRLTPGIYGASFGIFRLPTDALFYSAVTLSNIVPGSRYWIAPQSDLGSVLALGTAADTTELIAGVPVYTNPQLIEIHVRSASGDPRYIPLVTYAYQGRDGAFAYISQVEDPIV